MFKWNVSADAEQEFNINKSLNENWDKIDEFAKQEDEDISNIKAEQTEQINDLLNSGTYKNVTHIFSLDEIKPTFKVKYRKDLETLLKGGE